jgi:ribose-5-phosphate isomerase (EC 5.3.1.6)
MERIMTQDEMKFAVAQEALKFVVKDTIIGVGTGSTANFSSMHWQP